MTNENLEKQNKMMITVLKDISDHKEWDRVENKMFPSAAALRAREVLLKVRNMK